MSISQEYKCLVCGNENLQFKQKYELGDLFNLWKPIRFSSETITELEKQGKSTSLYFCPVCELEMFLPQIIGNDSFYKDLSTNPEAKYYENEKWDFCEAVNEVGKNESIIELGCGPGRFLELAQNNGAKVLGIEYNKDAIEIAKKRGFTIYNENFDKASFFEKFDSAFSFHVLEHVKDPLNFIGEMYHLVRKGGFICISVPNQDGPIKYIDPCIMNMPPHHATRWRLNTFIRIAKHLNLKIIRYAYEPLFLKSRSYYTYSWLLKKINKQKSPFHKAIFYLIHFQLELFFGVFVLMGFAYFKALKGQAIYVVFQK